MSKLIKSLQVCDVTFAVGKSWLISLVQMLAIAIKNFRCIAARDFYWKIILVLTQIFIRNKVFRMKTLLKTEMPFLES